MSAPASEPDLTFQWPVEKGFPYVLFLCVVGSLAAHVATFFLFQVVYPQRVTIPQPAPYVTLLTPSSPENLAYLRWIEAEDPALIATDNAVSPPGLIEVKYRSSFATPRTLPLGAPVEKSDEALFPPAVDRLQASPSAAQPSVASPTPAQSQTVLRAAGVLKTRMLPQNPELSSLRIASAPVSPTVILVGVTSEGEVRFPVIQQSSGDAKLDEMALAHLSQLRFAAAKESMAWGYLTFAWGGDVYLEQPVLKP